MYSSTADSRDWATSSAYLSKTQDVQDHGVDIDEQIRPKAFNLVVAGLTAVFGFATSTDSVPTLRRIVPSASSEVFSAPVSSMQLSPHLKDALAEMSEFAGLRDGWDGMGSVAPSSTVLDVATKFLFLLPSNAPAPEAMASADGDVGWYWKTKTMRISVVFAPKGKVIYFAQREGKPIARGIFFLDDTLALPADLVEAIGLA